MNLNKSLTMLSIMCFAVTLNAQVTISGYAFLEGNDDHSGTKVLFLASSPSAITDSVYTNSEGYFEISVSGGIYDVYYSHVGYYEIEILDQNFFSPLTLPDVTLLELPNGIHISGNLSGLVEDTTYVVDGNISVQSDDTLTIEPGVTFIFDGDYSFQIYGYLIAIGTEQDSIKFISSPLELGWGGIVFNSTSSDSSILECCLITGSKSSGIQCFSSNPTIINCTIRDNFCQQGYHLNHGAGGGIFCVNSSPFISNCTISENSCTRPDGIYEGWGGGIYCENSSPTILNCLISGNSTGECGGGGGIWCDASSPTIDNCLIIENVTDSAPSYGSAFGIYWGSYPIITNCTISNNYDLGYGAIRCWGSGLTMTNTIMAENDGNGSLNFENMGDINITFCDFYNNENGNFSGDVPDYLGELITINSNGDSCDAYFNIFYNPLFCNPEIDDYTLAENSPCIEAGDSAVNIGAFDVGCGPMCIEKDIFSIPDQTTLFPNYPNPFNPITVIEFSVHNSSYVEILVYDVMGRKVETILSKYLTNGNYSIKWNASSLPSGIYFIEMINGIFKQTQKALLLK